MSGIGKTGRDKELGNWFFFKIYCTILGRMLANILDRQKFNAAQRLSIKWLQHYKQCARLNEIAVLLARESRTSERALHGFRALWPYLERLDEFYTVPFTVDQIEDLCEESRRMLFPLEDVWTKYHQE